MRSLILGVVLTAAALMVPAIAPAQSGRMNTLDQPVLPKHSPAYLYFVAPSEDGKGIVGPYESHVFRSLEHYKQYQAALLAPKDSETDLRWLEREPDLKERQLMLEVRPGTAVKVLSWKIYVPETPGNREAMRHIDAMTDGSAKVKALGDITTQVYEVEIAAGNYKGRKGWVADYEVVRTLPRPAMRPKGR